MNNITDRSFNLATLAIKTGPTAADSHARLDAGIEVFPYTFATGGSANFIRVGARSRLTNDTRIQLRVVDLLNSTLLTGVRSKANAEGGREDREVQLLLEAQYIQVPGKNAFFGDASKDWSRRAPEGVDPSQWMDSLPTEGYIMVLGQYGRTRVSGGTVLQEGYTEKYGEIFGHVMIVRVRLGEAAEVTIIGEDGSEAVYKLTYDAKCVVAERI